MKKTGKLFSLLIVFLSFLGVRASAEVSISASVDKTQAALNDSIRVLVTVSGNSANPPSPQMPDLSAFTVYSSGRAQNISFVNGQISSSVNYTYLISPKGLGKFVIGPFSVTMDGKTVQSSPVQIEIVNAGQAAAPGNSGAPPSQINAQAPGAFVSMALDKSKAYVNEQVILTFRFYHRIQLISNPTYQPPETTGFLLEDLPPPRNFVESAKGAQYRVTEIKTALFPTQAGSLTLSPASLKIQVQDFGGDSASKDFFEQFFRGGGREYLLKTDPAKLSVILLPTAGKPQDFSGGVGEFGVALELDKTKVAVGEPFTLTLTVNGKGNIKSLGDPAYPEFSGFRKYDTASSLNIEKSQGRVEGSKVYKIVLVPQTSGIQKIPPIRFSYFHLPSKTYKTIITQNVSVEVIPGKSQSLIMAQGLTTPAQIKSISQEIQYIKLESGELKPFRWLNKTPAFLYLNFLPLLGILGGIIHRIRLFWVGRNPERRRREGALKKWEDTVKKIQIFDENSSGRIFSAFQNYFSDKMLGHESSLTLKNIEAFLAQTKIDEGLKRKVRDLWKDFEISRYAPAQFHSQDLKRLISDAQALLREIDVTFQKDTAINLKGILLCAAPFLLISWAWTQDFEKKFKEANAYYQAGQFESAQALYAALLTEVNENPVLEYNLGNTYFKLGSTGQAIAHWLRAYRMRPADSAVRSNLRLAGAQTGESFEPDLFISRWFARLFNAVNLNQLSVLYLLALWSACLCWTIILFSNNSAANRRGILFVLIFLFAFSWWAARVYCEQVNKEAVITQKNAEVRSGPGNQFQVGFTVPEGRKVLILNERSSSEWAEIGITKAGVRGWVQLNAFEKI